MSYDYRKGRQWLVFDWRAKYRFGFYQFGTTRVFRIAKLCIHLWEVR